MISGMNGVAVARHGPILWENEATPSGKLSKYLPGPSGPVFGPKTTNKIENPKNPYIYICKLPIYRPGRLLCYVCTFDAHVTS